MNKSQIIIIFLSVFLLTSLTANLVLFRELKKTFISLYQVSLNPLAIDRYNNQEIIANKLPKVVFFGDSRAYAWKFPQNPNYYFINRGISGQTSAQILARFSDHVTILKPQIIVLQLGVNDLRIITANPQNRSELINNCQSNIARIVHSANKINATVILTTIFPLGSGNIPLKYRPFWANLAQMKQEINQVNQYIKSFDEQVIVFDAYSLLNQKDPNKTRYYEDLLHLNRQGYELLNQELEKILREIHAK